MATAKNVIADVKWTKNPKNGNWFGTTTEGFIVVKGDKASSEDEAADFVSTNRGKRIISEDGRRSIIFGYDEGKVAGITKLEFSTEDVPTDVSAIAKAL
jgi:hypothetical protein